MNGTQRLRRVLAVAVCLLAGLGGGNALATDLAIQAFSGNGVLSFNTLSNATSYRVEWASRPDGPWSSFTGAAGAHLDAIPGPGSGIVTRSVPMFYRVVATLAAPVTPPPTAGDYMVIDLSAGPAAASYPLSFMTEPPLGGWTDEHKTTRLVLRRIPAGSFVMGSPTGELARAANETQHTVTFTRDFYVGVFEVTQRQWERVMGDWPSFFNNAAFRDTRPVERVSFATIRGSSDGALWPATNAVDAASFLGRLRARTGRAFDLPTESQWEYACRAGTTTALNLGVNLAATDADANMNLLGRYWHNSGSGFTRDGSTDVATAKAGSYLPNAWGLYDMHGNVWEWCLDWYHAVYPGATSDPAGPVSGASRVLRGGSWVFFANDCRSANRNFNLPSHFSHNTGFRIALPVN